MGDVIAFPISHKTDDPYWFEKTIPTADLLAMWDAYEGDDPVYQGRTVWIESIHRILNERGLGHLCMV